MGGVVDNIALIGKTTQCPYCKSPIVKTASKCSNCGEWIKEKVALYNEIDDATKNNISENDLKQLKEAAGDDAVTFAQADKSNWICVCGAINPLNYQQRKLSCFKCGRDSVSVLTNFKKTSF